MSARRAIPASLWWLGGLFALSVVAALLSGLTLFLQDRAETRRQAEALTGGHVAAATAAFTRYGCGSCHVIAGVTGAKGNVGPPLTGIATRAHLAGRLPNDPVAMRRWLQHPQAVAPGSGMPELGVTDRDARDMAAYLYTIK